MADKKISALTGATTPVAGTEVLPIVQGGSTVKVSIANLTAGRAVSTGALTVVGTINGSNYQNLGTQASAGAGAAISFVPSSSLTNWLVGSNYTLSGLFEITPSTAGGGTTFTTPAVTVASTGDTTLKTGNLVQGTAAKGVNFTANTPAAGMTSQLLNWYEEGTWTPALAGSGTAGTYELATASGWYTRVGRSITVIFNVKLAAAVTGGGTGFAVLSGLPFNTATTNAAAGAVTLGGVNYTAGTNYVTVMPRSIGSAQLIFEEVNINGAVNDIAISAFGTNDTLQGTLTYIV